MHTTEIVLAFLALGLSLVFDFVNGFHDTANACATVIYSKALPPKLAIILSGIANFLGAVVIGTAVAMVITKIIPVASLSPQVILSVLLGALSWNLFTWYYGLPVSSSHCLVGSLFGAGVAAAGVAGVSWHELLIVLIALMVSPLLGFLMGYLLTLFAKYFSHQPPPLIKDLGHSDISDFVSNQKKMMRRMQILSSMAVSFAHGSNDGQKTMGVMTVILALNFAAYGYRIDSVPFWVMVTAATAIGLGTMIGGWRVIRTVGEKISHTAIDYAHGFGAEFGTAIVIYVASLLGAPISTTHTLTSAVTGGALAVKGYGNINRATLKTILLAWVLTLPVAAVLSGGIYYLLRIVMWLHDGVIVM